MERRKRKPGHGARAAGYRISALALGLFAFALAYRHVAWSNLTPWSVFFHGVPAILAVVLASAGPRPTLQGRVYAGTTIALALAGTVAGEGTICVVIAAPFIYAVVGGVVWFVSREGSSMALLPLLVVMTVAGGLGTAAEQTATATTTSEVHKSEVLDALAAPPVIPPTSGGLLARGFPQVEVVEGQGIDVGDERHITFSGGGVLVMRVAESGPSSVVFEAVSDTTLIGEWVEWTTATFTVATEGDVTEVELELGYQRRLQPGWYFGPIVDLGMSEAAAHLLESLVP